MLRKKTTFQELNMSGKYPQLNNQLNYLESLQREIKGRKFKAAKISYRNKLREQQDRDNYMNEIHRIRGELSKNETRLPIGTRERLEKRVEEIKNLKYGAFNKDY